MGSSYVSTYPLVQGTGPCSLFGALLTPNLAPTLLPLLPHSRAQTDWSQGARTRRLRPTLRDARPGADARLGYGLHVPHLRDPLSILRRLSGQSSLSLFPRLWVPSGGRKTRNAVGLTLTAMFSLQIIFQEGHHFRAGPSGLMVSPLLLPCLLVLRSSIRHR